MRSMPEMPPVGEDHREPVLGGGRNHFFVTTGAARLNHRGNASPGRKTVWAEVEDALGNRSGAIQSHFIGARGARLHHAEGARQRGSTSKALAGRSRGSSIDSWVSGSSP